MTSELAWLCIDAADPRRLARFWGGVLGREVVSATTQGAVLTSTTDHEIGIRFQLSTHEKVDPNQMHLDLTSSTREDQDATVTRALSLGASHLDVGQGPDADHVVLADPEGNEFCVIEPGNNFLAGCGFVGALASDGTQACGYFWSEALGWPLVWDQDEETAIQSLRGGTKITWGGPPVASKTGKYRLHFDLTPTDGTTRAAEIERLLSIGAARIDIGQRDVPWDVLVDPDGHEFCVTGE